MSDIRRRTLGLLAGGVVLAGLAAGPAPAQETRNYILSTATTGGTYYPVGVALATLVKVKLEPTEGIGMSAISSAGSGENIKLMRENQAQFAILQGIYGLDAWNGSGGLVPEGKQDNLRSVTMLWQNVEHFLVRAEMVKDGTMADLAAFDGAPFSIGARNSGTEGSGRTILANLGIDPDGAFELAYMGYGPTADGLQNGTIMGANVPGGVPVGAITQAFANLGGQLAILSVTDEEMAEINKNGELWTRYLIPADTYPGLTEEVPTIAQPNFLAVNADVPEEDVYQITRTIYENLDFLNNIHAATKVMALDQAIAGLPAPLHPGALRFYEEQGMTIPDRLRPPS